MQTERLENIDCVNYSDKFYYARSVFIKVDVLLVVLPDKLLNIKMKPTNNDESDEIWMIVK